MSISSAENKSTDFFNPNDTRENPGFFVMCQKKLLWGNLRHDTLRVYLHLQARAGSNGECYPSYPDIMDKLGIGSTATVSRCLRELREKKLISVENRQAAGTKKASNKYRFYKPEHWEIDSSPAPSKTDEPTPYNPPEEPKKYTKDGVAQVVTLGNKNLRGKKFSELSDNELEWYANECNGDDHKKAARLEIDRRQTKTDEPSSIRETQVKEAALLSISPITSWENGPEKTERALQNLQHHVDRLKLTEEEKQATISIIKTETK